MKAKQVKDGRKNTGQDNTFGSACLNACKGVLAQIKIVREAILGEARETLKVQEHVLRLALNEAEALALQTLYPQLAFPNLAMEKIRGTANWSHCQRLLSR